jgi:hypothetical protein
MNGHAHGLLDYDSSAWAITKRQHHRATTTDPLQAGRHQDGRASCAAAKSGPFGGTARQRVILASAGDV